MRHFVPMSPILTDKLPSGEDWCYQLKWDGFRIIALVDNGKVELWSKRMLSQNEKYPELVEALSVLKGRYLFDGEAVIMDPDTKRPSFQKMQQRNKITNTAFIKNASRSQPVQYIIFDLLEYNDQDLRSYSFQDRNQQLQAINFGSGSICYLTDVFEDSETLWNFAAVQGWEGIISKRLSSSYHEGKDHRDWYKRKTVLHMDVDLIGIIIKAGNVSSLVMSKNGQYAGRVSSGLNGEINGKLLQLQAGRSRSDYLSALPEGLRGTTVAWLQDTLSAGVTFAEVTESGLLRQPQLSSIEGILL